MKDLTVISRAGTGRGGTDEEQVRIGGWRKSRGREREEGRGVAGHPVGDLGWPPVAKISRALQAERVMPGRSRPVQAEHLYSLMRVERQFTNAVLLSVSNV